MKLRCRSLPAARRYWASLEVEEALAPVSLPSIGIDCRTRETEFTNCLIGPRHVNDANRYAVETMSDLAYPLKLLARVVRVSMETQRIVASVPESDRR